MSNRRLVLGLYADEEGLQWVRSVVETAAADRGARLLSLDFARTLPDGTSAAWLYDDLAEQWAVEHSEEHRGTREAVRLTVELGCSLRVWRAVRKDVLRGLCPEGNAPHTCRVPWSAGF